MEVLWCWRCRVEMPMLDDEEFAEVWPLYSEAIGGVKAYRERHGAALEDVPKGEIFRPVLDCYERLTGFRETNPNAVMHHRISLYGPPCRQCGKPLRTPQARLCGSCMFPVAE
jgi:hypothetical protein